MEENQLENKENNNSSATQKGTPKHHHFSLLMFISLLLLGIGTGLALAKMRYLSPSYYLYFMLSALILAFIDSLRPVGKK